MSELVNIKQGGLLDYVFLCKDYGFCGFSEKRDMLLRPPPAPQYVTANQNPVGGYNNQPDPLPDTDDDSDDGDSHDVSTSDFIIMQSSFECKSFHDSFYVTSVLDACKLHWDYLHIRFNGRF